MSKTGIIYGINGPVVYLKGDSGFKISEMVYVGKENLVGEVIGLKKGMTTVQVFEETTGLRPGEKLYEELLMAEEGLTNTEYEKIFIGAPSFVDINELTKQLDALKEVANRNDSEGVKKMMAEIVPTYHRAKR